MAEYIERSAAIAALQSVFGDAKHEGVRLSVAVKMVLSSKSIPAADVAPVRHGRWLEAHHQGNPVLHNYTTYCCDQCGRREGKKEPYCNCGAKMDLEGGNT